MFVVAWKNQSGAKLFPVDDEYYGETEQHAKEAARKLLVPLSGLPLVPDAVVKVDDEYVQRLLLSDRDIYTYGDVEFINL